MKTKTLLISLCLLIGVAMTNAYGQDKAQKAEQGWFMSEYWAPVYCGDNLVDILEGGTLRVHYVVHPNGKAKFYEILQLKGEVTSQTGEVFKITETDKYYYTDDWYIIWHYNLIGNRGNHYIGTLIQNYFSGEIVEIGKTVCN